MGWLQTADYDILSLMTLRKPVDTPCHMIMLLWGVFWDGAFNSLAMVPITLNDTCVAEGSMSGVNVIFNSLRRYRDYGMNRSKYQRKIAIHVVLDLEYPFIHVSIHLSHHL